MGGGGKSKPTHLPSATHRTTTKTPPHSTPKHPPYTHHSPLGPATPPANPNNPGTQTPTHRCCVKRSSLLKMPTVLSPSSLPALMIRTAISPRLAASTDWKGMSNLLPSPAVCVESGLRPLLLADAAATTGTAGQKDGRVSVSKTQSEARF